MSKFQVLKYNQNLMVYMGIHSYRLTEPVNEFFYSISAYVILFFIFGCCVISSAVFAYQNLSDGGVVLQTCLAIVAGIQCTGMFLSIGLNMKTVKMLHLRLQQIISEADNFKFPNIYWAIEEKCRKYSRRAYLCIPFNQLSFVSSLIYSIYMLWTGDFVASKLLLPFNLAIPFDINSLFGWYLYWFIQFGVGLSYALCTVPSTVYFMCCCFYIGGICDHFQLLIHSMQSDIEIWHGAKSLTLKRKMIENIQRTLEKTITVHLNAFEIFNLVSDINSGVIFSLLPPNVCLMAVSFYNMEHSNFDLMTTPLDFVAVLASLLWPFTMCYYSSFTTMRLASLGCIAYDSNWNDYPIELRKYIVLLILRSQTPARFSGFNIIHSTLETFAMLFKSSCTYYLLFRSLLQHE